MTSPREDNFSAELYGGALTSQCWTLHNPPSDHQMPRRTRILFVDDEPSIRLTLPPVLEQHGFEVKAAGSVAEAVAQITASRFDVLISDLNVEESGDGFRVVSAMREKQPHCITLILTGYPGFETAVDALRLRVDDYVVKPVDVETLISSLRKKLDKKN
jgi:DNA-binding NtrC family response regulator